ncbi:MAG: hypothetical protein A2358_02110 [Candidatus Staskawiczbacteria bacterium RIFOXYB1_FULL_37_44]|uniref:DOD-type homing endonuclease domain-containing protein n=1 Tax=Candidatus Staskawiczbacteria bacterium RIFOXYB1_FULL_37_44 TaxID=1802223 RepID=A0A1G2ITE9_9BACT|nr:MAG: hypothetical protein A2358_02110 [Candidatus Staskawiczbacteria bacterium RIFOXYB1_FULL_37_44]OGZ82787.1 MAG: hypothetical protein A2416_03090 [Candidatus Staskawiczbacteria bacterium RIFOXYC1_FULL_37_52]OGZ87311.1 MAG: hypothetical protein A2444_02310 [Candidatus Staskawiczbacteria bacterium RIFOXYC2_FULL_37_19]OGZ90558.1 MAG: hypothetical protein A2581_02550 [Candidatus Staskawiczbacteria bacterium RIFOXYD1_FULL_37_110]
MRILLPKGEQQKFIEKIISKITIIKAAKICDLSERTIRDWRREKFLMDKSAMLKLCKKAEVSVPINFKEENDFWYVYKGSKNGKSLGTVACIKKYGFVGGDPKCRKEKWYKWWNKEGKYQKNGCIKDPFPIKIPHFSKSLAEFVGIMLGDGGITLNQISISTNSIADRKYGYFVKKLIKKLFQVNAKIYFIDSHTVMIISVSRKRLVEFCNKKLGLHIGNKLKQGLNIPSWIRNNPEFEKSCIRGLIDTDGSIFNEIHNVKGKKYSYKRLNFTSASPDLIKSVFNILEKNGLSPKLKNSRCVNIENREKIEKYFKIIGTSNPKHLKRYYN